MLFAILALVIQIDAPPSLASAVARIRAVDLPRLEAALLEVGLDAPEALTVVLRPDSDPAVRDLPPWVVGRAFGTRDILILPDRVARYPYDSLESVLRHEVVHLALTAQAGGRPVPRWFHEGVATAAESGWGVTDQARLALAALTEPTVDDVNALFRSEARYETELAYLLATALVDDLRARHGPDVPGRIARRVAAGSAFHDAFLAETRATPQEAADVAWRTYRTWTRWLPALVGGTALWMLILALASMAYIARRRRRREVHARWEAEERPSDC